MSEKKSIKETLEMLDGLGAVAVAVKKIAADGKVNASDLAHVIDLAKKVDVLAAAVDGAGEIVEELKDLDEMEVMTILAKLYEISNKLK